MMKGRCRPKFFQKTKIQQFIVIKAAYTANSGSFKFLIQHWNKIIEIDEENYALDYYAQCPTVTFLEFTVANHVV